MNRRPQPNDRFRLQVLHRWYTALWVLFGLIPPVLAVLHRGPATKYVTMALVIVLVVGWAMASSRDPVLRPAVFLGLLVLVLGAMSYLLKGGAALFIVSLPQFWIYASNTRRAVTFTSAAAAASLTGALIRQEFFTGNVVFTVLGYAGGTLIGLWLHRVLQHGDEQARRLGAELAHTQAQLAEANQRQGAADERERIAREIHDTLAQGFASIIVLAQAARTGLGADQDTAAKHLLSIERTARENLTEARILVSADSHSGVASIALADILRRTLDRFSEDTGLRVTAELPDLNCDQPIRIALLRCTQESLANIRKHATAKTVGVVLARHPNGIELEITDDGRGFAPADARGFGLDGMRKRLAELGGELTVTSSLGDGTRVLATVPSNCPV
ncbi:MULTISPECIES: sensor histidine kinase [unclassified Nocardia]|uniref:sensor histidine kinase n=1 Tax=unclassified Nocardia TaxID=2637762 RepID=UPI001CE48824|nr:MULTISPECIES: sensor histidine kinase [unclassified Nocardia]